MQICRRRRRPYEGKSTFDLSKSRYVKNHLVNRQIEIHMRRRSRGVPVPTDSCRPMPVSVTTVMDVSQYSTDELCDNIWCRLWRVVKPTGSYGAIMTTHVSFEVTVPSTFDSHKLSSWKVVHQYEHVNTRRWTTFQRFSLWLSMSTGLWPQTTHMRRHKSPTAVDAQHVRWSSEWPIDHNSFLFVSSHIFIP